MGLAVKVFVICVLFFKGLDHETSRNVPSAEQTALPQHGEQDASEECVRSADAGWYPAVGGRGAVFLPVARLHRSR